jgi:hypothetical protein
MCTMQKIKKALKKLGLSASKPAIAAKTAPSAKKKTQSLAAKKSPPKAAGKKVVKTAAVKAAPKKAAPPAKAVAKKAAPPAKAIPKKDVKPTTAKVVAAPAKGVKATAKSAAPAAKVDAKSEKAAATPKAAGKKADETEAKLAAPESEAAPAKVAKGKKARAEEVPPEPEEEIVLLDAEGRRYCRVRECDQASAVDGYCRYHYLLYWKNIQVRKKILSEGKLERYIEELTARYPDKYLEMLKKDLRSEKEFLAAIQELEIDESSVDNEYEDEAQNYLDEVRGMSSEAGSGSGDRDEEF